MSTRSEEGLNCKMPLGLLLAETENVAVFGEPTAAYAEGVTVVSRTLYDVVS